MKVLKVLASTLLSLLLFLCLTVMGVAITVNSTALSSRFVTNQVNKLDVVALFNEKALPELQKSADFADHPEVITAIQNAVVQDTPALKAAVNKAIRDVYGYLVNGGQLDLRLTLKNSVLDPNLAISIINDIDLSPIINDLLVKELPLASADIAGFKVDLTPYADSITTVIQPWFKQQFALLVSGIYDYILGYSSNISLEIPIKDVMNDIKDSLKAAILASPPSSLAGLSQSQLSQAFEDAWTTIAPDIPETLSLDTSEISSEQPNDLKQSLDDAHNSIDKNLADAQDGLAKAREWIVYYQEGFWGLVGLTLFIVLCIILVNRDVKAICRILGSVLVPYGVIETAGIIVARVLAHSQMAKVSDMPQSLQPWLAQFIDASTTPLLIFAISCAALGIVLFIVSFIYGRNQEKPATV